MAVEAFPLYWPEGWKRCRAPIQSRFKTGFGAARVQLSKEIARMGGTNVVISTNVPLRNDGMPRASAGEPKDAGVAVYFRLKDKDMVFACDKYHYTRDNIYSIAKTIEALRSIERWGASDMMERAFAGFKQLPSGRPWWEVLDVREHAGFEEARAAYRSRAMRMHPDQGGSAAAMAELNVAWDQARVAHGA